MTIPVVGLNTNNSMCDDHLRSADWFEAETSPAITFRSTSGSDALRSRLRDEESAANECRWGRT